MKDPVTGFEYPAEWVARCAEPEKLPLVEAGRAVLTASGTVLKRGYTTGTTAAAACKAAVLTLSGQYADQVSIRIPCGLTVEVPVDGFEGKASCIKNSGDYSGDVTNGVKIVAEAIPAQIVQLITGDGIGKYTRDTPRFRKGTPAISTSAYDCIMSSIREGLDCVGLDGVKIIIHIPQGGEIAKKTLNPRIGVEGGISILGTTGLVEPWDDHVTESVRERISKAKNPVLTTGRIGLRFSRILYPDNEVILIGGKITDALSASQGEVILCGLPALILRHIDPHILDNTGFSTVEELAASPQFKHIMEAKLAEFKTKHPSIKVILINREGAIVGESP